MEVITTFRFPSLIMPGIRIKVDYAKLLNLYGLIVIIESTKDSLEAPGTMRR